MINPALRALTLAAAFAAGAVAFAPAAQAQAGPFDGQWSVVIITRSGGCDPAYRIGIYISNGVVSGNSLSGRVSNNGSVSVVASDGRQTARGSGRLSRNSGGGSWSGRGPTGSCSGSWSAQRS
jgi:hypothetical protein